MQVYFVGVQELCNIDDVMVQAWREKVDSDDIFFVILGRVCDNGSPFSIGTWVGLKNEFYSSARVALDRCLELKIKIDEEQAAGFYTYRLFDLD